MLKEKKMTGDFQITGVTFLEATASHWGLGFSRSLCVSLHGLGTCLVCGHVDLCVLLSCLLLGELYDC